MARSALGSLIGELWSGAEFLSALARPPDRRLPAGDGSGVILIPGLWGGDTSLFILRRDLAHLGYDARTWGLGLNNACGEETLTRLLAVARRRRAHHRRPLAAIGHSRGGFMARELARRAPDLVDLVITLGTPIAATTLSGESLAVQALLGVSRAIFARRDGCMSERCECEYVRGVGATMPPNVVAYSLFSRADGVVTPERCALPGEPAIEVPGSHVAMVANREVFAVITKLLARHRCGGQASASG